MADGRLSHDEYSERLPVALSARTLGELAELTADLASPEHQPVQVGDGQPVTALFTAADRRGRWVVPGAMTCVAAFGEVVLDMREAILDRPRREWIPYLWRGLRHPGLRRKSAERSIKLLFPRRWFARG